MNPFKLIVTLFKAQLEFEACREYAPIRSRAIQRHVDWAIHPISYWKVIPVSLKTLALLILGLMTAIAVLVLLTTPEAVPHIDLLPY